MKLHMRLLGTLLMSLSLGLEAGSPIAVVPVARQELPRMYRLDGVVEAISRTTISAQTRGQVREILFDVDDYVEEGSLILLLKDTEQQAMLSQAEADLKAASAHLQEVRDEYQRIKGVFQKQLVSQSEMDRASASLKAGWARQEAAAAQLRQASEQFEYTRVRAPYSGIVTERHIETGEIANPGQKLMSGISLDKLRVTVDVPQSLIQSVREGGTVTVRHPTLGDIAPNKVTIYPFANQESGTFRVRLDLPAETTGLFPGMFVKTAFHLGVIPQLLIPAETVVYRGEVTGVYVVRDDGRISLRHIRPGAETDDGRLIVLAGLDEGEQIATNPIAAGAELKSRHTGRRDD